MIPPKKLKAFMDTNKNKDKGEKVPPYEAEKMDPEESQDEGDEEESTDEPMDEGSEEEGADDARHVQKAVNELNNGGGDKHILSLVIGYDPELDGDPPEWAENGDLWERAKAAVDPEGAGAEYEDPWSVVAHVYKRMGGVVTGGEDAEDSEESTDPEMNPDDYSDDEPEAA